MRELPGWLVASASEAPPSRPEKARKPVLFKSLEDFTAFQRQLFVRQDWSRFPGLLQSLDPRLKLVVSLTMCLLVAWSHAPLGCLALLLLAGGLAWLSRIPPWRFYAWPWLIFPVFSLLASTPALTAWITPGAPIFAWGPLVLTRPGLEIVLLLFLRTATSLSWVMLLVSTTPWADLLQAARGLRLPEGSVMAFGIFWGYLLALVRRLEALHLGRISRLVQPEGRSEGYRWLGAAIASLFRLTDRLARDIGDAMEARGYDATLVVAHGLAWTARDSMACVVASALIGGYLVLSSL